MEEQEFTRCREDVTYFVRHYCQIRHPLRGSVAFALWDWQAELLDKIAREQLLIVLKARQLGVSELAAAYALWRARFIPGWLGLLVSRNQSDAGDLLDRIGFMYDHLPPWLQATSARTGRGTAARQREQADGDSVLPVDGLVLRKRNTSVLEFGHVSADGVVPSRIQSLPATKGTGRGKPASWVFLDEWAHQPWQPQIFAAIKPTLSTGGAFLGVSTANGVGNVFHQIWVAAERDDNGFKPLFLSWRVHPERDEAWHVAQARSMEAWQLAQEHPASAIEAFVQSGRPVFDAVYLTCHEERMHAAARLVPSNSATEGMTFWEAPVAGHRYVIGADVAEGLADGDFDAAVVLDATATPTTSAFAAGGNVVLRQVAALRGKWAPDIFARKLTDLGQRYGLPLLAVERNNHGHACLLQLRELHYPRLYHAADALSDADNEDRRPGWLTTRATKPLIIDTLAAALREYTYLPLDPIFLAEALIYGYRANGAMGAPPGFHDDVVMAHAIAVYIAGLPDATRHALTFFADLERLQEQQS